MAASMLVRFEWPDDDKGNPISNRFYAASWEDVEDVLDEMSPDTRSTLTRVVWPAEEDDGLTQCGCGAVYWRGEVLTCCPKCGAS